MLSCSCPAVMASLPSFFIARMPRSKPGFAPAGESGSLLFAFAPASAGLPGLAPAGEFPFFACPKKGNRKKRQPQSGPLRGSLRCSVRGGDSETCFAQTSSSLIPSPLRCSALPQRRGIQNSQYQKQNFQFQNSFWLSTCLGTCTSFVYLRGQIWLLAPFGFWGQSPNLPSLWLARRVRRFAPQQNWCLTPITKGRGVRVGPK